MGNPRDPLTFETTYHIYNHAVGDDRFFREEKNYYFFMGKFIRWIKPVTDVLSYCLIPNHFHFCLRVKSKEALAIVFEEKVKTKINRTGALDFESNVLEKLVAEQFSHCFNSYAQAYNKEYDRMGSLFKESFQRKIVDSDDYLRDLICYIHNNPLKHGLVSNPSYWKHSSFNDLFLKTPTIIQREEVIQMFDSLVNLEYVHRNAAKYL
jgi:putative transposase